MLFAVTDAKGVRRVGYVHGAGGSLARLAEVEKAIRQATKGRAMLIYEPIPGHVRMDVEGVCAYVDIRGATVSEVCQACGGMGAVAVSGGFDACPVGCEGEA